MTKPNMGAIRARLDALGNVTWELCRDIDSGDYGVFATTPSGKQWQVALTADGLGKEGTVPDFIASAPADIRALLAQHDADQGRIKVLEDALDEIIEAQRLLAAEDENTTPYQLGAIRAWEIVAQIARRAREGGE